MDNDQWTVRHWQIFMHRQFDPIIHDVTARTNGFMLHILILCLWSRRWMQSNLSKKLIRNELEMKMNPNKFRSITLYFIIRIQIE